MSCKCNICQELQNKKNSLFSKALRGSNINNAYLTLTENLAVIPSIGPLNQGHCLIVTRTHSNNVMHTALSNNIFHEIESCLNFINDKMNIKRDDILLVSEHGSTSKGKEINLCSTTHGHLHVIPIAVTDVNRFFDCTNGKSIEWDFSSIQMEIEKLHEYGIFFTYRGNSIYSQTLLLKKNLESQYFRKLVGNIISNPEWDWHEYPNNDLLLNMVVDNFHINKNIVSL